MSRNSCRKLRITSAYVSIAVRPASADTSSIPTVRHSVHRWPACDAHVHTQTHTHTHSATLRFTSQELLTGKGYLCICIGRCFHVICAALHWLLCLLTHFVCKEDVWLLSS